MPYDESAAARLRTVLSTTPGVVEKEMMGALVFMVDGTMCCGITGDALMLRVGPAAYRDALSQPHVRPFEMAGRRPGGFVCIDPEGYADEPALRRWLDRGVAFASSLPRPTAVSPAAASRASPAARRRP